MLQQTQVATVLPRYSLWLKQFPDIKSLAAADENAVLKAWEGLGYYRRARYLHAAARKIMNRHNGAFPHNFEDIVALPGIGRSTAGAIASFCFEAKTPVLDGNVRRVLSRWRGIPTACDTQLWERAQSSIDSAPQSGVWNQAMMELGATVCTPKSPGCASCPISKRCVSAFQVKATDTKRKPAVRDVHWQVCLHTRPDKGIWLTRRPDHGIWGGLWSPPVTELQRKPLKNPCHIHQLTHRKLHLYGIKSDCSPSGDGQWVADITKFALPTGIHRLLQKLGVQT